MEARAYVESHAREFIDDLKQWLAIPSISADPMHHSDVRRSAGWLAGHLRSTGFPVAGAPRCRRTCGRNWRPSART